MVPNSDAYSEASNIDRSRVIEGLLCRRSLLYRVRVLIFCVIMGHCYMSYAT